MVLCAGRSAAKHDTTHTQKVSKQIVQQYNDDTCGFGSGPTQSVSKQHVRLLVSVRAYQS